jgi:hypothetical protein
MELQGELKNEVPLFGFQCVLIRIIIKEMAK